MAETAGVVAISAAIEAEIAQLPGDEQRDIWRPSAARDRPRAADSRGYGLLDWSLSSRSGEGSRAWTVTRGTRRPQAAGAIHTIRARFIRAQTIRYEDSSPMA